MGLELRAFTFLMFYKKRKEGRKSSSSESTTNRPRVVCKIKPVNLQGNQPWIFIGRTDAEAEAPILWPPDMNSWLIGKDWCWERLKAGGEGDDRGWDDWIASLTQRTRVWVNSGSWWWTGRPGMLQSMGLQRVGYNSATELVNKTAFRILVCWAGTEMRVCFRILDDGLLSCMISVISNVEWCDSF